MPRQANLMIMRIFHAYYFIVLCAVWAVSATGLVTVLVWQSPVARAVLLMADGLLFFWILLGGLVQYRYRDVVREFVRGIRGDWRVKFVLFCTILALLEEAVTTAMTNCAPLLGVKMGQAYITASANYLDVVGLHSVVVFVPMFVCWAVLLSRFDFRPNRVLILFGITGLLAELDFDPNSIFNFGFWILVYGLMIYQPAYCLSERPGLRTPRWYHYPVAVFLPFVFVIPVAGMLHFLHPIRIHFPPIRA